MTHMRVIIEVPEAFRGLMLGAIAGEAFGRDMPAGIDLIIDDGVSVSDEEMAGLHGLGNWGLDRIRNSIQQQVYAPYREQLKTEKDATMRRQIQASARAAYETAYASVVDAMSAAGQRVAIRVEA
jgi:hypothetical protein